MLESLRNYIDRHRGYVGWRLRNPFGSFEAFYIYDVERRLDAGSVHPTLGLNHRDGDAFGQHGVSTVEFLQSRGLKAHHRTVDYGCGSLRVGRHLMTFLEPGQYVGMDITDRFYNDGLSELDKAAIARAAPTLRVISEESTAEVAKMGVDFIFSTGVVSHVHPSSLQNYFDCLWNLSRPGTQIMVRFRASASLERLSGLSWSHPPELLSGFLEAKGARVELLSPDGLPDSIRRSDREYETFYLMAYRER